MYYDSEGFVMMSDSTKLQHNVTSFKISSGAHYSCCAKWYVVSSPSVKLVCMSAYTVLYAFSRFVFVIAYLIMTFGSYRIVN